MTQIINMSINNNCYPDDLKLAEVSPVFKKDDLDKGNYRPVSVTFYVSKVFERIMYQQIDLMKDRLSNLLTGFRKNHNTQHFLMSMLERWKKNVGQRLYMCNIYGFVKDLLHTESHIISCQVRGL